MNRDLHYLQQGNIQCWKAVTSDYLCTAPASQATNSVAQTRTNLAFDWQLTIALSILVILPIVGYRKCRVMVRHQRIKTLERLWQLSSDKSSL